jgi:hypothetical protein
VAHPRNPSGRVSRKWLNEDAVLAALRSGGLGSCQMVDLAQISIREQIALISKVILTFRCYV